MQLYNVLSDGELQEIKTDKTIREHLKRDSVFLVVDDDLKRVWIWKGSGAPVRQKFISARAATQIREERGLTYKVNSEDEGDESDDFVKALGETPKPRREIKAPPPPIKTKTPEIKPSLVEREFQPGKPEEVMSAQTTHPHVSKPITTTHVAKRYDYQSIIKKLDEVGVPAGFERELVIVGDEVYTIIEQTTQFLGTKQKKKHLEKAPMGTVPEGVFLAEEYTPRVIVDNGNVMAIEFLKQAKIIDIPDESKEVSSLKDEMKFHLSDLVDFFKIEITDDQEKKEKKKKK